MRQEPFVGLFRALPRGEWHVGFPDLPGCAAKGKTFKDALEASRRALAEHLFDLDQSPPRTRSAGELLIDAQRDWMLCRQLVDAVMHPVEPADLEEMAPLELVASGSRGGGERPPQIGI